MNYNTYIIFFYIFFCFFLNFFNLAKTFHGNVILNNCNPNKLIINILSISKIILNNNLSKLVLSSLRCLSAEFHGGSDEFDHFQSFFVSKMTRLGFKSFTVYYGDGKLRTLSFWK